MENKTTKKRVYKKTVVSPDEFQTVIKGINSVVPKAKKLLKEIKPNQTGMVIIFFSEGDAVIKDGTFMACGTRFEIMTQLGFIIEKLELNPVELLNFYIKDYQKNKVAQ